METSIPGIFACGNVVHVHDVVDFVTEESIRAAANAVRFVKGEINCESEYMNTIVSGGISYCVPQRIRYSAMPEKLDLFMRVDDIYPEAKIIIKNDGKELARFKKLNLTPGEMIKQTVRKSFFEKAKGDIEISLEIGDFK